MAENNKSLTVSKVINADRETIFEALTNGEIMQKWFYAGADGWSATVENDPKVGGKYQIDMHGKNDTYSHEGKYKEIIPNEKLVFTWNSHAVQDTVVTITLSEVNGGTEVKLKHDFLPNEEMKKNHTEGWKQILIHLNSVVVG
ncbi:SRPBCC domain-containing protein [Aliifodinibius sp. S!AR15-10]|uniref:SRPBCC family protein n=1 Tax=Aliifodinibius sp. S!AR15-10 TaxID=2950437 RepID=UPI00285EC964|nr:SRPBCC domain-containing protein [Aliifodinibius sp. S!AR15-10]MDR8390890.1 SRPBCC domain-containing protein [Aliifodinibius sp. S!AR15-10]